MPVSICPRCKHINPDYAAFCYFDGVVLQAQQNTASHRLPGEFVFPSGRRCETFDDLAQGCQEEWSAARGLLMRGVFAQFFRAGNRADMTRAADDAKAHPNPDIALMTFVTSLPGARTQTPKLDLHPRRILLGALAVGDTKTVPLTITNQGQSMLQGTMSISEGQDWLSLSESKPVHEIEVAARREQLVKLTIRAKGLAAGQTYGAKLTVVTNGGVVEVPLRMDLAALAYPKAPFQGARTQRELAEKMRQHPKAAVPVLESDDVRHWYALNGWTYPVKGPSVRGVGGVQQFFEGIGVSKPPAVSLSQQEFNFKCPSGETVRGQVTLQTSAKKWVYAQVTSDSPWLKAVHPQVAGPQHVAVPFEIDAHHWNGGPVGEGKLTLEANGGQKLTLKVTVEVQGLPALPKPAPMQPEPFTFAPPAPAATIAPPTSASPTAGAKFVPALVTTILLCLALRVLLIPFVDCLGRNDIARAAALKLGVKTAAHSPINDNGGWLRLPWLSILAGGSEKIPAHDFQPDSHETLSPADFRHYFVSYFIRWFVLCTFWIGAIVGAILVLRRGGIVDLPWGVIAGAVAGLGCSATVAAFFLAAETVPHLLWHLVFRTSAGAGFLVLWILLALISWLIVGIVLGMVLPWIGPLRRCLIDPFQGGMARLFGIFGLAALADYWRPN